MIVFDPTEVVGDLFPTEAGTRLAEKLLELGQPFDSLEVDLTACKPAMLIGSFFNAVLQTVHDHQPEQLESARRICWRLAHEFQREIVSRCIADFKPVEAEPDEHERIRAAQPIAEILYNHYLRVLADLWDDGMLTEQGRALVTARVLEAKTSIRTHLAMQKSVPQHIGRTSYTIDAHLLVLEAVLFRDKPVEPA